MDVGVTISRTQSRTPVLVLGSPHRTTLGVIRALARAGIPQFAVGAGTSFVSYCRWHRRLHDDFENDPNADSLSEFLGRLSVERMVLIPCSDAWVAAVGRLERTLAARFPASIPPQESLDICLDKSRFANMMARLGLPHPRTISIGAFDDVRTLWDSGFYNPFLKPRNSLAFSTRFQKKALLVANADEAIMWIREAGQHGIEFVLQEYIPGPATNHYYVDGFIDRMGTVCARFARRCVRLSDDLFGVSSCMVSIPLNEAKAPIEILDQLLPALRYRGVFNAQFKYDERDGLFKLLDLNPRAWGGVSLAVSCGVNVIDMAYQDALGRPVGQITSYPVGRYWVNAALDNAVCWQLFREGRLTARAWLRTRIGAVPAIFRWDDPLPAIVYFVQATWREIRRRLRGTP